MPRPEGGKTFLPSSPCARDQTLGRAADLAWFHLGYILHSRSDEVDRFLTPISRGGCLVGNT